MVIIVIRADKRGAEVVVVIVEEKVVVLIGLAPPYSASLFFPILPYLSNQCNPFISNFLILLAP